jgi:hypothetical protein
MSFDYTQIKTININLKGTWNPETHNIVLEYDPTVITKFRVKIVDVEPEVLDLKEANEILEKLRNRFK